ncbi:phosphodiester glycosidase family protein [Paenibacillus turpanensis]|uniref:phosphodiester glycosidase family protein n=1 Tax=Paenibacillus turpanensis TaxID=2689078 RepID=UPI00140BFD10|nr:phosphodiester glycosidase family protein [Paenibacillus turpanensis]
MNPTPTTTPGRRQKKKKLKRKRWIAYSFSVLGISAILFTIWFYLTPWGTQLRYLAADTLITTQHRHWAKYLIGEQNLKERVNQYWARFDEMAEAEVKPVSAPVVSRNAQEKEQKPLAEVKEISGANWKGYLLIVNDPKKIRLVVPNKAGKGEKVSSMVKRTGALYGVNGGGFADPNWKGNGFQPIGIVISDGKVLYHDGDMNTPIHVVGLDQDGVMIAGKYKPNELLKMNVKEAVTFAPRFIVNGEGLIKNHADGWGIAPRTSMAQTADGTILFAVIDGRQPHSIGATLYDIQNVFLEHDAVIAANLDGGSSTVLVKGAPGTKDGFETINSPASQYGERYLPTAFVVHEKAEELQVPNIWEGIDMTKFDSSKW